MVANKSSIKDVSIMYVKDDVVVQEKYSAFKNETRLEVYQEMMKDTRKIYNDLYLIKVKKLSGENLLTREYLIKFLIIFFTFLVSC